MVFGESLLNGKKSFFSKNVKTGNTTNFPLQMPSRLSCTNYLSTWPSCLVSGFQRSYIRIYLSIFFSIHEIMQIAMGFLAFLCVALGGMFIGMFFGFLSAYITKFTSSVQCKFTIPLFLFQLQHVSRRPCLQLMNFSDVEPIVLFTTAYMAYFTAELFHWSGILRYFWHVIQHCSLWYRFVQYYCLWHCSSSIHVWKHWQKIGNNRQVCVRVLVVSFVESVLLFTKF